MTSCPSLLSAVPILTLKFQVQETPQSWANRDIWSPQICSLCLDALATLWRKDLHGADERILKRDTVKHIIDTLWAQPSGLWLNTEWHRNAASLLRVNLKNLLDSCTLYMSLKYFSLFINCEEAPLISLRRAHFWYLYVSWLAFPLNKETPFLILIVLFWKTSTAD